MISKKKCENCAWYQPLDTFGICEREDGKVDSDPGFSCKYWRGIKYDRVVQKKKDRFDSFEDAVKTYERTL